MFFVTFNMLKLHSAV